MRLSPLFPFRRHLQQRGFALVITLIVIALLTIIVTAFLTSSGTDRLAARAYLARAQADAAARGAADEVMATLKWAFEKFPDSVTAWEPAMSQNSDGTSNPGTVLYLRAKASGSSAGENPDENVPSFNGASNTGRQIFALPLTSGVVGTSGPMTPVPFAQRATAVPAITLNATQPINSEGTDVNLPASSTDINGWIGTLPGQTRAPIYARWVPVNAPAPTTANPSATKLVTRYAFWVEDESFRIPINTAGTDTARRDNSNELPLKPSDATLASATVVSSSFPVTNVVNRRDLQSGKVFPESRGWTLANGITADMADQMRFLFSTRSSSLNLSRHGSVRLNLNTLGATDSTSISKTSPTDTGKIQVQVDTIIATIGYHLPNFSERFYRKTKPLTLADANLRYVQSESSPTFPFRDIYLRRIAANIRDAIDEDSVPTIISSSTGKVVAVQRPDGHPFEPSTSGTNPYHAIGKEGGPFLQEGQIGISGTVTGRTYNLTTHYYAELWNPTDRDIDATTDLGPSPFLKFRNAAAWRANNPGGTVVINEGPDRDITISLTGKKFRAGRLTVVTTDSSFAQTSDADVILAKDSEIGTGKTTYSGTLPTGATQIQLVYRSTNASDYEHTTVIGSDWGFIEGALGSSAIYNGGRAISIPPQSTQATVFAGSLHGNVPTPPANTFLPNQLGDPRTNNDQITFQLYDSSGTIDQTRYFNATGSAITIGSFNSNYTDPSSPANPWGDYYSWPSGGAGPARAGAVVPNRDLVSIGELGHVFDPAQVASGSVGSSSFLRGRGGGRTLKIGQPDDRVDADPLSASSEGWASWRLADVFCVDATTATARTGSGDLLLPGRVNLNGVRRDNGAALRSALFGFKFLSPSPGGASRDVSHGDPATAARSLDTSASGTSGLSALVAEMTTRLSRTGPSNATTPDPARGWGPFWERGELSELAVFASNGSLAGIGMAQTFDRGREELFRRLVELVTTRGNVFTVYAVGQSLFEGRNDALQVLATSRLRITFRLNPYFGPNSRNPAFEGFNPSDSASVSNRFGRPSRYDLEILEIAPAP